MKNTENWIPTKFDLKKGVLKASRNKTHVSPSSRLIVDRIGSALTTYIPKYLKGKMVDLGCGNVPLYKFYKPLVDEVICVDWENTYHDISHLDIVQDLNQELKIENEFCDSVLLTDVLEHIKKPQLLLNETFRILKPKGNLLITVPFFYWLHETPFDYYRYTEFALKDMAEEAKFEVIEIKPYGGILDIIFDLVFKFFYTIPLIGKALVFIFQPILLFFLNSKLGDWFRAKTAMTYPLGYIAVFKKP